MRKNCVKRILVALDLTHQSGREQLDGFYRHADKKENWKVLLVPSMEVSNLPSIRRLLSDGVDGIIIKGRRVSSLVESIRAADVPTVIIDKPTDIRGFQVHVCNDNEDIGEAAAKFFASLGRFASYGFVPNKNNSVWSQTRCKAFRASIAAKYVGTPFSIATLPLSEWLRALPKPAAVFTAFDVCGRQVLECCREQKINVPSDVIVLGVDDDALVCDHTRPKLSSIHPDHAGQGFAAAKALDRLMSTRWSPKETVIACPHLGITERDTTSIVPPAVHIIRKAKAFIAAHALEGIHVEDVVRHLGVSSRLANLRFSQALGHSIRDELVTQRLVETQRLLAHTEYPIGRIAKRCGFNSATVLSHLFRAHFGKSMRDWRQQNGIQNSVMR